MAAGAAAAATLASGGTTPLTGALVGHDQSSIGSSSGGSLAMLPKAASKSSSPMPQPNASGSPMSSKPGGASAAAMVRVYHAAKGGARVQWSIRRALVEEASEGRP